MRAQGTDKDTLVITGRMTSFHPSALLLTGNEIAETKLMGFDVSLHSSVKAGSGYPPQKHRMAEAGRDFSRLCTS